MVDLHGVHNNLHLHAAHACSERNAYTNAVLACRTCLQPVQTLACCTYKSAARMQTHTCTSTPLACKCMHARLHMCVRTSARALGAQCLRALARCACAHKHAAHRQTPRACMLPLLSLTQRFRHIGSSAGLCLTHRPSSPGPWTLCLCPKKLPL